MRAAVEGRDTLALMPTGSGKSLTYQLAAMLRPEPTLVLSPLIALMKDQVDKLPPQIAATATFVNSSLSPEETAERLAAVSNGDARLVYAAPERLRQSRFVELLARVGIGLVVVDEVHCVSMWGHDFRPDYLFIDKCLPQIGHPTLLALTATATPEMRAEIATQLGRDLEPVVASVFRPNLYYEVEELDDKEQKMRRLVEICKEEQGSGVVYARSRESCEQLAAMLRREGVRAAHYHAGMEAAERLNEVVAGTQEQMIRVAQHDPCAGGHEIVRRERLDRRLRPDRHEHGRVDHTVLGGEATAARGAVGGEKLEAHQAMSIASPYE